MNSKRDEKWAAGLSAWLLTLPADVDLEISVSGGVLAKVYDEEGGLAEVVVRQPMQMEPEAIEALRAGVADLGDALEGRRLVQEPSEFEAKTRTHVMRWRVERQNN
jgi:hypothetical protein